MKRDVIARFSRRKKKGRTQFVITLRAGSPAHRYAFFHQYGQPGKTVPVKYQKVTWVKELGLFKRKPKRKRPPGHKYSAVKRIRKIAENPKSRHVLKLVDAEKSAVIRYPARPWAVWTNRDKRVLSVMIRRWIRKRSR